MYFFNKELLTRVDNQLDWTVRVHTTITVAEQGLFAWVCVEVSLNKPLILGVKILGHKQLKEYEGLHLICFYYDQYSHKAHTHPTKYRPRTAPD